MSLLNNMEQIIDDLSDQFYYIKIKFRNLVKSTKEEHNYQCMERKNLAVFPDYFKRVCICASIIVCYR